MRGQTGEEVGVRCFTAAKTRFASFGSSVDNNTQ